mgnify:CR=1 FL=1
MQKILYDTVIHLWGTMRDILRDSGYFKTDSEIYLKAVGFEDELYQIQTAPNSENSEVQKPAYNNVSKKLLLELQRYVVSGESNDRTCFKRVQEIFKQLLA